MAKTKKLGDLVNQTVTLSAPLSGTANLTDTLNFSITKANTSTDGYVSSTDWNIFNNKQDALGFTPYNATNPDGYISGITSGDVTTALGFTPYDSANPSGYITSSALTPYAPIDNPTFTTAITTPIVNGVSGVINFNNAVQTSGAITAFTFTKPNNTTQTASTSISGFVVNGGTRQWNTGNIGTQNENVWGATTYSFVGASTITNAFGNVFNAPIAGTNTTITNNFSAQFNGQVQINGSITNNGGSPNLGSSGSPYGTFFITNVRGGADLSFGSGFSTSGDKGLVMFGSTRNIVMQNGGTFTDNGYRLEVVGLSRFTDRVAINYPSLSSTYKLGVGGSMVVNGQIIVQDDSGVFAAYSSDGLTQSGGFNFNRYVGVNIYSSNANPIKLSVNGSENFRMFNGGNILIQNGGTFTNNGFRLDVNGTGRFQNTLTLATGTTTIAPLKLTAGTNLTTPVNGSFEFDGTNLYFTVGGVRKTVTLI